MNSYVLRLIKRCESSFSQENFRLLNQGLHYFLWDHIHILIMTNMEFTMFPFYLLESNNVKYCL